jgi:hypothetical protein
MILRQIALVSQTPKVTPHELMTVSSALQKQVTRDFAPAWNIEATVDAFSSPQDVPAGYWKITVMDKIPAKGAAGFHLDQRGQPYADVLWSKAWSLSASHECLEMLADPFGHQLATGLSPKAGQGRVSFLVEVCDPCEASQFAYTINSGSSQEVAVSDFYTPDYFAPVAAPGVRYSFRGSIKAPRQVLEGGYLSWQTAEGDIWQLFGPASMDNFQNHGKGTLNRQNSDMLASQTRERHLAAKAKAKAESGGGKDRAELMAAGGQCNLTRDPFTGDFDGTAGAQTTVQIKDSTGAAKFLSIGYAGQTIGSNTAAASFTIQAGTHPLAYVYAAPVPGDEITVVDPCGTVLDRFNNDGEPNRLREVNA